MPHNNMDPKYHEGKRNFKEKMMNKDDGIAEEDFDDEVEEEEIGGGGNGAGFIDHDQKKKAASVGYGKRGNSGSGGSSPPSCQVEKCGTDLSEAKRYHRRHKVCEVHAKAPAVVVAGMRQRFCQQCSRFHELTEFDETKRSCRRRLQGHNERRRKSIAESSYGEGASSRKGVGALKENHQCRQADERGRYQITLPGNSSYKKSQIR